MKFIDRIKLLAIFLMTVVLSSCNSQSPIKSPNGYNLDKPEIFSMASALHEISGIAFQEEKPDTMFALEDENGRLYHFKPGNEQLYNLKFGKKGDYEDVAILNGQAVILRSDGTLFTFPVNTFQKEIVDSVQQHEGLLPNGEFESLYADERTNMLYVLCKDCSLDKQSKNSSGFILQLNKDGTITAAGDFKINIKEIEQLMNAKKITFRPSGLSKHLPTGEWYIISSVNKILVIAGNDWKIKNVYKLDPSVFNQPEGITFDRNNNLYISNEGGDYSNGRILRFNIQKE